MHDAVELGLLGPLRVRIGGGPEIRIAAGRQRAILATLALHAGRPVRAWELIDVLWGDDPPATALKSLQTYVARLRRLLPAGWVVTSPGGYTLSVEAAAVDAVRFERAVAVGGQALRSYDYEAAASSLASALGLWRGDPVDVGDQQRGLAVAARLRELRLGAEEGLAEARLALGAGEELVADLEAAVQAHPLREQRWRHLMVALYRGGRQADALSAYQRARAMLVEHLGVEPGPELRATERAVLDQSPTLRAGAGPARTGRDDPVPPLLPPSLTAIAQQPMAGRCVQLQVITEQWRQVVDGGTRLVIAHGEPGMGKTRLVGEVASNAHSAGALVLFGRCDQQALTPYQPVVDALRALVRAAPSSALGAGSAWEVAELSRLVPELADRLGREPAPLVEEPGARHRLFEAVVALLGRQARVRPMVLVVDDLQWIDRGGAALLAHLVRARPPRFLLLATHRSGDTDGDARLAGWAGQLPPDLAPQLVPVGALDEDAVNVLAHGDRTTAATIHAASRGIPLLVTELLRFHARAGRLPQAGEIPDGLRHTLARRVGSLGAAARGVVQAAAIAAEPADISELASATGIAEPAAFDAVDEAIGAYVLAVRADRPGSVTFTHDLLRATALADATPARLAYLHRRLAAAIIAGVGSDGAQRLTRAAEIAHHLASAAGRKRDPDIVPWAQAAGRHAMSKLAWENAIAHFELALAHVRADQLRSRARLQAALAGASRAAGNETVAKRQFTDAISVARSAGHAEDAGRIVLAWTETPVDVRRDLDEAIATLRHTLDDMSRSNSTLRAQLMGRLAFSLAWAGDPEARAAADAAVAMARRTGDPAALARTLFFSTSSRDQFDAFDPSGCAGELRSLLPRLNDPVIVAQALIAWLVGCVQRGDRESADTALDRLETVAGEHRLIEAGFRASVARAHLALADGDVALADRDANKLLETATTGDLPNLFLFAGALLYDVRRAQGRLAELLPWFESVHDSGQHIARVRAMRVEVLTAAGRHDEAAVALTDILADLNRRIAPAERPHSIATLATVASALRDETAARILRAELEPWAGLVVYDGVNGPLQPVSDFIASLDAQLRPHDGSADRPGTGHRSAGRHAVPPVPGR